MLYVDPFAFDGNKNHLQIIFSKTTKYRFDNKFQY